MIYLKKISKTRQHSIGGIIKPVGKSKKNRVRVIPMHDAQKAIIANRRRFNIPLCGRRFGKTTLGRNVIWRYVKKGGKVGIFVPERKDFEETWEHLEKDLAKQLKKCSSQSMRMTFKTGGKLEVWSLTNKRRKKNGRGRDYDCVMYDETQSIQSDILRYHWQNVARATLSDRQGDAWFLGTPPNSKKHYFYDLICQGAVNNPKMRDAFDIKLPDKRVHHNYKFWMTHRYTAYDNPYILDAEIENAKLDLPELVFQQEYLAHCVEYAESPFVLCLQELEKQQQIFTRGLKVDWRLPVWISFDFNKNPMAATLWQQGGNLEYIHAIKEFGAPKGKKVNIQYTCKLIQDYIYKHTGHRIGIVDRRSNTKIDCPNFLQIKVTGDATGNTSDSRQLVGRTYYEIIMDELGLRKPHLKLFRRNPPHSESFIQVNTWMAQHPNFKIDEDGCPNLRYDCLNAQATGERKLDKATYDPHFLDTLRYYFNIALPRKYSGQGRR